MYTYRNSLCCISLHSWSVSQPPLSCSSQVCVDCLIPCMTPDSTLALFCPCAHRSMTSCKSACASVKLQVRMRQCHDPQPLGTVAGADCHRLACDLLDTVTCSSKSNAVSHSALEMRMLGHSCTRPYVCCSLPVYVAWHGLAVHVIKQFQTFSMQTCMQTYEHALQSKEGPRLCPGLR